MKKPGVTRAFLWLGSVLCQHFKYLVVPQFHTFVAHLSVGGDNVVFGVQEVWRQSVCPNPGHERDEVAVLQWVVRGRR